MVKILVADSNPTDNATLCQFLANDKKFIVKSTTTGSETLDMYWKIKPNILIINSHFNDFTTCEILDRLSSVKSEAEKSNAILTINENENIHLRDVSKIKYFFNKPFIFEDLMTAIENISKKYYIPDLLNTDIESFLQPCEFNSYGNAYKYAQTGIEYCYYRPEELHHLDHILRHIAYAYNKNWTQVRDSLNDALDPLRNANYSGAKGALVDLFYCEDRITTKTFFDVTVSHLRKIKGVGLF